MTGRSQAARALRESAPLFAALGDETRLAALARLCQEGPLSITELTVGADVSRQAVTKHLEVLASAGVVTGTRDGREKIWKVVPRRLSEARRLLDVISSQWDDTLDRLKAFVED